MSSVSNNNVIAIIGATGNIGREVVRFVLNEASKRSERVSLKLLVRDSPSSDKLQPLKLLLATNSSVSAEFVQANAEDAAQLDAGLKGVERLFFVIPLIPGFLHLAENIVQAAKKQQVKFIMAVSSLSTVLQDKSPLSWLAQQHASKDSLIRSSGIDYTLLLAGAFMSNLVQFHRFSLIKENSWNGSNGGISKYASIDPKDIAEIAAKILVNPTPHKGRSYVLTGGEAVGEEEVAALASSAWGRTIKYVNLSTEAHLQLFKKFGAVDEIASSIIQLQQQIRNGLLSQVSPDTENLLGRKPTTWAQFLQENKL